MKSSGFHQFGVAFGVSVLLACAFPGCASKGDKAAPPSDQTHASGQFAPIAKEAGEVLGPVKTTTAPGQPDTAWTIVIASTAGDGMEQEIQKGLDKVRTRGGLPDAYSERRGKSMVIAYGRYSSPDSKQAQDDLKRIQNLDIDGGKPFAAAVLAPPPFESLPGSIPEYDLSTLKRRRGKDAMYTLQVAAYARMDGKPATPRDLAEFRAAAEKAAVELRREGEEAFYHHGRNMSEVTVGVFGDKDLDLVNGQGVKVWLRGHKEPELEPSRIIVIPN
jgi:hypothetical protein